MCWFCVLVRKRLLLYYKWNHVSDALAVRVGFVSKNNAESRMPSRGLYAMWVLRFGPFTKIQKTAVF